MQNFKFTSTLAANPDWIFKAVLSVEEDIYIITNETLGMKDWVTTMSRDDVEYNFEKGCYKFVH